MSGARRPERRRGALGAAAVARWGGGAAVAAARWGGGAAVATAAALWGCGGAAVATAAALWGCGGATEDAAADDGAPPDARASEDARPAPPDGARADAFVPPPPIDEDRVWTPDPPAALAAPIDAPAERPIECRDAWISVVRGWIVAPGGAPLAGARAQLCVHTAPDDELICLYPGTAGEDGVFTVEVPEKTRCMRSAAMRVLLPGAGKATTYCPVTLGDAPVLRIEAPYVLFQTRGAVARPPRGDVLETRPVTFDDGLAIDVTPEAFYSGSGGYDDLGGRRVPVDARGLCFLEGHAAPDGLYAFYPEGSFSGDGAPVRLPNATGLPAGARVELSVLGGLDCRRADGTTVREASWDVIGVAHVTADGASVESDPGVGLPCLTWLGYRHAPGP